MARCSSCDARPHFVSDVDTTGGLVLDPVGRWRCPTCGQRFLRVKEDATLSQGSDGSFFTRIDQPEGCERCLGNADTTDAWGAITATRAKTLYQASHVGFHLDRCACGTTFAIVFTERIDWVGGEDDQTWLALPLFPAEAARVEAATAGALKGLLEGFSRGRRFLLRFFPTGGTLGIAWREHGFAIGPHD